MRHKSTMDKKLMTPIKTPTMICSFLTPVDGGLYVLFSGSSKSLLLLLLLRGLLGDSGNGRPSGSVESNRFSGSLEITRCRRYVMVVASDDVDNQRPINECVESDFEKLV